MPEVGKRGMPNLFVIGASKAGSSALHAYLKVHPQISMGREKEPCFFVDQDELRDAWPIMARQACSHDRDAYLDLFEDDGTVPYRGEGSVFYSQSPHRSGVPARIAAESPDARIIYSLREPVSRTIAHFWQRSKEFAEPLDLADAIEQNGLYRDTSDYALQLKAYLEHFPMEQIFVLTAEDLKTNRLETLERLQDWLGVDRHEFSDDQLTERHKSPPTSRRERLPLVRAIRDSGAWASARKMLPKGVVGALRTAGTSTFDKADVDTAPTQAMLKDYFDERITELEDLLGRRFTAWR